MMIQIRHLITVLKQNSSFSLLSGNHVYHKFLFWKNSVQPSNMRKIFFFIKKVYISRRAGNPINPIYYGQNTLDFPPSEWWMKLEGKRGGKGRKGDIIFLCSNVSFYFAFEIFLTSVVCSRKVLTYIVPLFDLSVKYTCKQISSAI